MSSLIAIVKEIKNCDSLNIVKFNCLDQTLTMMSLELSDKIKVGTTVKLIVKPTHIAIGKNFTGDLSYSNQLDTTIKSIENGQLLSGIKLSFFDTTLESIITVDSSLKMELKVGDKITAFIKSSDISIGEIIDD